MTQAEIHTFHPSCGTDQTEITTGPLNSKTCHADVVKRHGHGSSFRFQSTVRTIMPLSYWFTARYSLGVTGGVATAGDGRGRCTVQYSMYVLHWTCDCVYPPPTSPGLSPRCRPAEHRSHGAGAAAPGPSGPPELLVSLVGGSMGSVQWLPPRRATEPSEPWSYDPPSPMKRVERFGPWGYPPRGQSLRGAWTARQSWRELKPLAGSTPTRPGAGLPGRIFGGGAPL